MKLERKIQPDKTPIFGTPEGVDMMMTPAIDEEYWLYRVKLSETQSVVGFPKFGTIGIGFAVEDDWNTNLPYSCGTAEIATHIGHNKGDDAIADDDVLAAIKLIQDAAAQDRDSDV